MAEYEVMETEYRAVILARNAINNMALAVT